MAKTDSPDPSVHSAWTDVGPAVARELVRSRLKALREASELSPATVADHTGWSISKLTRIEKGEVTVQPLEVRALLQYYGVDDENEVAALAKLSQASRARQWYSKHRLAGDFQRFVAYESEASVINIWQVLFVPGLLQTEEYARAITALSMRRSPDDKEVLARVRLRMDRQQAFRERLGRPDPPRIVAVIDESVLRRPVGGRDAQRRQLDHLLDLAADKAAYTIAVTPLDLVHHSGLGGTFELLQFGGREHGDVLFVEAAAGTDSLTMEPEMTGLFRNLLSDLLTYGRSGDDALELIRSVRASLPTP
ncbi:helix-turn-helix domain-containing protein [Dactylosporangium aurantiacum]|uniref:Helix-turn-helix domain-containing protein n=1 Tax=Dactylosporangium aurantiacum TaxID=35754 RepID=A0A9Q9IFA6_9ACTN|nr:helix-turn-helix transcriptional regulator [Dactylosporangium aurantiacum]UWZ55007.1 helix-turn-helix domain-containing protein [Dactylosporangium aurantiacum]